MPAREGEVPLRGVRGRWNNLAAQANVAQRGVRRLCDMQAREGEVPMRGVRVPYKYIRAHETQANPVLRPLVEIKIKLYYVDCCLSCTFLT